VVEDEFLAGFKTACVVNVLGLLMCGKSVEAAGGVGDLVRARVVGILGLDHDAVQGDAEADGPLVAVDARADHEVGYGQLKVLHDLLLVLAFVLHHLGSVHGFQKVDEGVAGFVAALGLRCGMWRRHDAGVCFGGVRFAGHRLI